MGIAEFRCVGFGSGKSLIPVTPSPLTMLSMDGLDELKAVRSDIIASSDTIGFGSWYDSSRNDDRNELCDVVAEDLLAESVVLLPSAPDEAMVVGFCLGVAVGLFGVVVIESAFEFASVLSDCPGDSAGLTCLKAVACCIIEPLVAAGRGAVTSGLGTFSVAFIASPAFALVVRLRVVVLLAFEVDEAARLLALDFCCTVELMLLDGASTTGSLILRGRPRFFTGSDMLDILP